MRQELQATVRLTFDSDAKLSTSALGEAVQAYLAARLPVEDTEERQPVEIVEFKIETMREEAEIYSDVLPDGFRYMIAADVGISYRWTTEEAEIAELGKTADAIEIAPCSDLGDSVERCDGGGGPVHMWSVYYHFSPEWKDDPNELRGAFCIADRDTLEEAEAFARELSERFGGLPINLFN